MTGARPGFVLVIVSAAECDYAFSISATGVARINRPTAAFFSIATSTVAIQWPAQRRLLPSSAPLGRAGILPLGNVFRRRARLIVRGDYRLVAGSRGGRSFAALDAKLFDLGLREMFDAHKGILRGAGSNEFVELRLNGRAIAILSVLDQKDHQERDDRRSRIDDQLPCVREAEEGSASSPHDNNHATNQKCGG